MPLFTSAQYTTDPAAAAAFIYYNGTILGSYSPPLTLPSYLNYTLEPYYGTAFHTSVYTELPLKISPFSKLQRSSPKDYEVRDYPFLYSSSTTTKGKSKR